MSSAKSLQKSLAILKASGIDVPEAITNYIDGKELESRGVKEVWGCSKCDYKLEFFVGGILNANHVCSASKSKEPLLLKRVWKS